VTSALPLSVHAAMAGVGSGTTLSDSVKDKSGERFPAARRGRRRGRPASRRRPIEITRRVWRPVS